MKCLVDDSSKGLYAKNHKLQGNDSIIFNRTLYG